MTTKQHINPDTISKGSGLSQAVKVGNMVYIAGQISRDKDGNLVGEGDAEAQVRQVWRNIEAAVQAAGGTLQDVVKTTTYVTKHEYTAAAWKVRNEVWAGGNPPTSTMLIVAALAQPGWLVEIESIAVVE